ncbi:MAG: hypothetical protein AB7F32_11880 [Victivallaceae bacterium]
MMRELITLARAEKSVDFYEISRNLHSYASSPEINVPFFAFGPGESLDWVRGVVEHYRMRLVITPEMRAKRIAELDQQIELLMSRYSGLEYISVAEE